MWSGAPAYPYIMVKNPLITQLEDRRFHHAVSYVEANAIGLKKLTTNELSQLNQLLTGDASDPWRASPASVTIPSGKTHQFNLLSNPIHLARDIISSAQQTASNGDCVDAAFQVYSRLVLEHLFNDANRRTAALACLWVVKSHGREINAEALASGALGDLREKADIDLLRKKITTLIK
jgi:hypothetical protein